MEMVQRERQRESARVGFGFRLPGLKRKEVQRDRVALAGRDGHQARAPDGWGKPEAIELASSQT